MTRRSPNFAISQWHQLLERPLPGAKCAGRGDLPWDSDIEPDPQTLQQMRNLCGQCPALIECAQRALHGNSGHAAGGGMYAGVWLPWMSRHDRGVRKAVRREAEKRLRLLADRHARL